MGTQHARHGAVTRRTLARSTKLCAHHGDVGVVRGGCGPNVGDGSDEGVVPQVVDPPPADVFRFGA